jgi:hypothetical protein
MYYVVRTQLYLRSDTWSITLLTTCFVLDILAILRVFLKRIELLYKQYGVLGGGGGEMSFTILLTCQRMFHCVFNCLDDNTCGGHKNFNYTFPQLYHTGP